MLLVRAFIFEPFRIPSDSMMPTLLDGDFIVVNKYSYGLRLPVVNRKIVETGSPQRGDVVVFRYPPHPEVNFIKRLVGLPGDRIEVRGDHLIINGEAIAQTEISDYTDGCYVGLRLSVETLGEHTHKVMSCHSEIQLLGTNNFGFSGSSGPLPSCDRKTVRERKRWLDLQGVGHGRYRQRQLRLRKWYRRVLHHDRRQPRQQPGQPSWGLVPEANLVGKATRIWLNFDPGRTSLVNVERIGTKIE